jgi:hypothetical protein
MCGCLRCGAAGKVGRLPTAPPPGMEMLGEPGRVRLLSPRRLYEARLLLAAKTMRRPVSVLPPKRKEL